MVVVPVIEVVAALVPNPFVGIARCYVIVVFDS